MVVTVELPAFLQLGRLVAAGLSGAAAADTVEDAMALYQLGCHFACNGCPAVLRATR